MKKIILLSMTLAGLIACQEKNNKGKGTSKAGNGETETVYRLRLDPIPGTAYHYDMVNTSQTAIQLGERTLNNRNETTVGVLYTIGKDSAGNILLNIRYDKIKLHSVNGDHTTDLDAANAATSGDPVEKMLGWLKEAEMTTVIGPNGEIRSVTGYEELTNKIMSRLDVLDINVRQMALGRWQQLIGEGVIKKNVEQLFRLFPDSAVTVGDAWTINSSQKGELNFKVVTHYELVSIEDGIAHIQSEGEVKSDSGAVDVQGYKVAGNLKGAQRGKYELETASGMLLNSEIKADVEGKLTIMGQEVPVIIKSTVTMKGKKVK